MQVVNVHITNANCRDFILITPRLVSGISHPLPRRCDVLSVSCLNINSGHMRRIPAFVSLGCKLSPMQLGSVCLLKRVQRGLNTFAKEIEFLTDCCMGRNNYNRSSRITDIWYYVHYYYYFIIIIMRHLCETCVKIKK